MDKLRSLTVKGQKSWESSLGVMGYIDDIGLISYDKLMALDDYDFLKSILGLSEAREFNHAVDHFRAYDIAKECYESGYMTVKQRAALTNVFLYYQDSVVWEKLFWEIC